MMSLRASGAWGASSSTRMSDISTNLRSRIRFTTLRGKDAAGLKGPFCDSGVLAMDVRGAESREADAAAASRCRPWLFAAEPAGVKRSRVWETAVAGVMC